MNPNNEKSVDESGVSQEETMDVKHPEAFADRKPSSAAVVEEVEVKRTMDEDIEHHHNAQDTLKGAQQATDEEHSMTIVFERPTAHRSLSGRY
jgi:hypothetical protein